MNKILSIKAKKKFILIAIAVIMPVIPISLLLKSIDYKSIVFSLVSLFFLYKAIWMLLGQLDIESDNKSLAVKRKIAGIIISKKNIDFNEITSVQINQDANDESYTDVNGLRIPDKIPFQILINTNTKSFEIGRGLESFDVKEIIEVLEKGKITIANNSYR